MSLLNLQVDEQNCVHKHIMKAHSTATILSISMPCPQKANVFTILLEEKNKATCY